MRIYEKRSRLRNIVIGAVIVGAAALAVKYRAGLRKGEAHVHYAIDGYVQESPRLKRASEFLSYPTKELQKFVHGWSEEDCRRNEQEYRDSIDKIVHGSESQ